MKQTLLSTHIPKSKLTLFVRQYLNKSIGREGKQLLFEKKDWKNDYLSLVCPTTPMWTHFDNLGQSDG